MSSYNGEDPNCKQYSRHSQRHPLPGEYDSAGQFGSHMVGASRSSRGERFSQSLMQGQLQRSTEASKQMLYGTFGNLVASLEEFEQRELKEKGISKRLSRSNIAIPDQRHKKFADVKSNVETQILLFETQSKACPPEVRAALLEDLKRKTIAWAAVRSEKGLPENQETDRYISKVYEILAKGRTDHDIPSSKGISEGVMRDSFQAITYGDHDRQELDRSFKRDPHKKARAPDTRHSEMYDEAAKRISRALGGSGLESYLQDDIRRMRDYGPSDLK